MHHYLNHPHNGGNIFDYNIFQPNTYNILRSTIGRWMRSLRRDWTTQRFMVILFALCMTYSLGFFGWMVLQSFNDSGSSPGERYGWRPLQKEDQQHHQFLNPSFPEKYNMVICSKVSLETPYLLEWIEFHRIQGVDKFVLYHDAIPSELETSAFALQLHWLPILYREVETRRRQKNFDTNFTNNFYRDDIIDILPISLLNPALWENTLNMTHGTTYSHRTLQMVLLEDCVERYKDLSEYIMHIDVDEFVYSPTYPSILTYLQNFESTEKWRRYFMGRAVGIYIPSINFGSSGQFWDFHNTWFPDASTGTVKTYFDPNDSTLFQIFKSLLLCSSLFIPKSPHSKIESSKKANMADHLINTLSDVSSKASLFSKLLQSYRLNRLLMTSNVPAHDENAFFAFVTEHLNKTNTFASFRSNISSFLLTEQYNAIKQPCFMNITTKSPSMHKLFEELIQYSITQNIILDNPTLKNSTTVVDRLSILKKSLAFLLNLFQEQDQPYSEFMFNETYRAQLYQRELARSNFFYPLIIEEQILRGPTVASNLETSTEALSQIKRLFPICSIDSKKDRRDYLHLNTTMIDRDLELYENLCKAKLPHSITQSGKVIYFTKSLFRSNSSRQQGRMRGCLRPWIHGCGHSIDGLGRLYPADAVSELRLDHHQFRSLQRRSFNLPGWRGGPLGYLKHFNYTILQMYLSSVEDTGKLRFVPHLRQRLLDFHPLPYSPTYNIHKTLWDNQSGNYHIYPNSIFRQCTPLELLGEHQVMCPKKFPYVGIQMTTQSVPNPYLPYEYCSITTPNLMHGWEEPLRVGPYNSGVEPQTLEFDKNVILCPGYGEVRCCNYDEKLVHLMSKKFSTMPRVWSEQTYEFRDVF